MDIFKKMPKRNLIWILIILAMAAVLLLVWHQPAPGPTGEVSDFQPVEKAFDLISDDYYQPLQNDQLRLAAVRGMVESLDEFSTYVPPKKAETLTDRVMGNACGTGLVVMRGRGMPDPIQAMSGGMPGLPAPAPSKFATSSQELIVGVLPNSPAHKAGIGRDWKLLAIDGVEVNGLDIEQVRKRLAGAEGSEVKLLLEPVAVHRQNSDSVKDQPVSQKPRTITLIRRQFPVETVQGLYRDVAGRWVYNLPQREGLFYIRISEFCPETPAKLRNTLRMIVSSACHNRSDAPGIVETQPETPQASLPVIIQGGLILDLRGNPGGLLPDGVLIADMFLAGGEIVTVTGRGGSREVYNAHKDSPYENIPLVVLVDENTASAAELLAGALSANARAVVVGTRTRGKGSVQTMLKLPAGLGQVNLTTAEFFIDAEKPVSRRKGMSDWGITPSIEVANQADLEIELQDRRNRLTLLPPPNDPMPGCIIFWPERWARYAEYFCNDDAQLARAIKLLGSKKEYEKNIRRLQDDRQRWKNMKKTAAESINREAAK